MLRYLSYSKTLALAFIAFIAVPGLRPGWDMFVLVCSRDVSHLLKGWREDRGPTNVGAMVNPRGDQLKYIPCVSA